MTILKWILLETLLLLMLLTLLLLLWTMILKERHDVETWCSSCCCDWWLQGFVITFAALIVDVARANEAAVVVPYCELIVVLGFDAYVIDVHDANICISSCRVSSCYCCDKSFYWYWSSCWCCSSGSSRSSRSVNHDCTFEGVDCVLFID